MEKVINTIKSLCKFKMTTEVGDTVLIYSQEQNRIDFGRVIGIEPDIKRGWFVVSIMLLQIPFQKVNWQLVPDYFTAKVPFKMNGKFKFVGAVDFDRMLTPSPNPPKKEEKPKLRVIK